MKTAWKVVRKGGVEPYEIQERTVLPESRSQVYLAEARSREVQADGEREGPLYLATGRYTLTLT